jgi:hypothetical protein
LLAVVEVGVQWTTEAAVALAATAQVLAHLVVEHLLKTH